MNDHLATAAAVLAKCAAIDPNFPPITELHVAAWAEQFTTTNLITRDDLLAGVTAVYRVHGAGFKPLPCDIVAAAKMIARDRYERRALERAPIEPLGAGYVAAMLAVSKIGGGPPLAPGPRRVRCPWPSCRAAVGERCVAVGPGPRRPLPIYHPSREEAYEAAARSAGAGVCACGDILDDGADVCDRCAPVIDGPRRQPNGDSSTA